MSGTPRRAARAVEPGPRLSSAPAVTVPPVVSGERLVAPDDEATSGKHTRSTVPPPMSQEEYDDLARTTPPARLSSSADAESHASAATDPPAARRSASLARMNERSGPTAPSRRSSDAASYNVIVPRAPLVPALTIPGLRATAMPAAPVELDRSVVLYPVLSPREVKGRNLDHRAGFILSLVDGVATVEEILDMCPMSEADALALLGELVFGGIVRT